MVERWPSQTGTDGPSPFSVSNPPHGTPTHVWAAGDGLGPSVPAHTGAATAAAPGFVVNPHSMLAPVAHADWYRWSQPVFSVGSAPRDPRTRLGRRGRAGTIGTGPHRRCGTEVCIEPALNGRAGGPSGPVLAFLCQQGGDDVVSR